MLALLGAITCGSQDKKLSDTSSVVSTLRRDGTAGKDERVHCARENLRKLGTSNETRASTLKSKIDERGGNFSAQRDSCKKQNLW